MNPLLELLHNRNSYPASQLNDPAPDDMQLREILRCGISAPDHGMLRPWRFIVIRGEARHALADAFVAAEKVRDPLVSAQKLDRIREKPLRSPLILVIVATLTPNHPKVPEIEQMLSAGAAAQLIQLGAVAAGFGSIWLTGPSAYAKEVKDALGIDPKDQIAGFVYVGTPPDQRPARRRADLEDHVSEWNGPKHHR